MAAIRDQVFRDFVFAMQETGCRPSEAARVTAADVNLELGVWVFADHKTAKKTGKPRIVYLTPAMVELTKRLMAKHPDSSLFRSLREGKPFARNGIRCRFKRLRQKLSDLKGLIAYAYRHSFATDALVNGAGMVQVAELLGHTSTKRFLRLLRLNSDPYGYNLPWHDVTEGFSWLPGTALWPNGFAKLRLPRIA